ncbi:MAG: c-type cytochrome [Chloroflexi bacterium]|nr:c-type cytochrome [Chloroflexota bacterium]
MRRTKFARSAGMAVAIPAFVMLGLAFGPGPTLSSTPPPAASPTPFQIQMKPRRLIIPDLGPNATQADYGERAYLLVCSACHGDRGQGLTNEWRAQWVPADQNCWQSKCHAPNHPPDGFVLPRYAPPLLGPNTLLRFTTALELHDYIHQAMPWQDPGNLAEDEFWQITAYLVRERGLDPTRVPLNATRAATLRLHAQIVQPEVGASTPSSRGWVVGAFVVLIGLLGLAAGFLLRRARGGDA